MATVNSSNSDRAITQQRDAEQRKKFSEAEKKHRREIAQIRQQHADELRKLKQEQESRLDSVQRHASSKLNDRDKYYQDQIKQLQNTYYDRVRKVSNDYEAKMKENQKTYTSELKREKETSFEQKKSLRDSYENNMRLKEEQYSQFAQDSLQQQNDAMKNLRDRMLRNHDKELKLSTESHNQEKMVLETKLHDVRTSKNRQITKLKNEKEIQRQTMSDKFENTIQNERRRNEEVLQMKQDLHNESLDKSQSRYDRAIRDYIEANDSARETFKQDVTGRNEKRISSLKQKIRNTESEKNTQYIKMKQAHALQMQHLRDQMRDAVENVQGTKDLAIENSNYKNNREVERMNKKNQELMTRQNRNYRVDVHNLKIKHDEDLKEQVFSKEMQNQHLRGQYEDRIDMLNNNRVRGEERLREYYETAIKEMQLAHQDELKGFQDRSKEETRNLINSYKERFKVIDKKNREKISSMQMSFENKLRDLKEAHLSDIRAKDKFVDRDRKNVSKEHIKNLDAVKQQAEVRLAQLKEQHEESMSSLEQRHRREMEALVRHQHKA